MKHSSDEDFFHAFIESSKRFIAPWLMAVFVSDFVGEILIEEAEKHGLDSAAIVDNIPPKETIMIREYHDALKIKDNLPKLSISELRKDPFWTKIEAHVKKYEWIGTHHLWGEPMTTAKFLDNLKHLKKPAHKKIKPTILDPLLKIAGDIMFIRQSAPEFFDIVAFHARPIMTRLAAEMGLKYEEFIFLTPEDIANFFQNHKKPTPKHHFAIISTEKIKIITDINKIQQLQSLLIHKQKSGTSITGTIASKGSAIGHAKVFLIPENFDKMKQGDILITSMTTPDFVPLMQRAAGIVTDIGGLLSHAAIISREMSKPCIVGTGSATSIFKDGDLVEVDANNGTVKKLK